MYIRGTCYSFPSRNTITNYSQLCSSLAPTICKGIGYVEHDGYDYGWGLGRRKSPLQLGHVRQLTLFWYFLHATKRTSCSSMPWTHSMWYSCPQHGWATLSTKSSRSSWQIWQIFFDSSSVSITSSHESGTGRSVKALILVAVKEAATVLSIENCFCLSLCCKVSLSSLSLFSFLSCASITSFLGRPLSQL
jgi:hypothetical protein